MTDKMDKDVAALRKDIEQLKLDLKAAADDGGDLLQSARETLEDEAEKLMANLRETAGSLRGNLKGAAQAVGENVRSAADTALGQGEQLMHTVEDRIEDKPLQSMMLTFGAGFVLGWLLSRK